MLLAAQTTQSCKCKISHQCPSLLVFYSFLKYLIGSKMGGPDGDEIVACNSNIQFDTNSYSEWTHDVRKVKFYSKEYKMLHFGKKTLWSSWSKIRNSKYLLTK